MVDSHYRMPWSNDSFVLGTTQSFLLCLVQYYQIFGLDTHWAMLAFCHKQRFALLLVVFQVLGYIALFPVAPNSIVAPIYGLDSLLTELVDTSWVFPICQNNG